MSVKTLHQVRKPAHTQKGAARGNCRSKSQPPTGCRTPRALTSQRFFCEYDRQTQSIVSLKMNGKEVEDGDLFTVALQEYHFMNMKENLDVEPEEAEKNSTAYEVATKCANVLQEYLKRYEHLEVDGEQRLVIRG